MDELMDEYRCECGKMLLRGLIVTGSIEVKCRFCKKIQLISGLSGNLSTERHYMVSTTSAGEIARTTTSAQTILGYSESELGSKKITELFPDFTKEKYETIVEGLENDNGRSVRIETHHITKNGSLGAVLVEARAFPTKDNNYVLLSVTVR